MQGLLSFATKEQGYFILQWSCSLDRSGGEVLIGDLVCL